MDDPDNKLGTIALSWMAASRVADLRASAAELAELCKEEPLPEPPVITIAAADCSVWLQKGL